MIEEKEVHGGLTKEDVWGEYDPKTHELISKGMVVAVGTAGEEPTKNYPNVCPLWKDKLPYKSVTVICTPEQANAVEYWLVYVHGGRPTAEGKLTDGRVAIRSDYQCW